MKYITVFDWNLTDMERINELWIQRIKEMEKGTDRFPITQLFEPHFYEAEMPKKSRDMQGFWIFETKDPMHLLNYRMYYAPYLDIKFIPITPNRFISEEWLATRKEIFRSYREK